MHLITQWLDSKKLLDTAQTRERILREQITKLILEEKIEGAKTSIVEGYKLSATAVLNYTLDRDSFTAYSPNMTQEDLETVEYRPVLIIPAYRKLPADSLMHRVVTVRPGMSQLKVIA